MQTNENAHAGHAHATHVDPANKTKTKGSIKGWLKRTLLFGFSKIKLQ
jgi:hypothetical protein